MSIKRANQRIFAGFHIHLCKHSRAIKIHMLYTVQNVYKHVDNVDNLLAEELFSNIYNVSGPHSYQQVTLCTIFKQKVLDFVESREIFARSTDLRDQFLQVCGGNSEVISLSGCINISKNDMICQGKSLGKFRKQSLGTCISMRLENTPDLFCVDNSLLHGELPRSLSDDVHNHR